MGGWEQPPIDKKSRRMRNDCSCTVVVAHEGNRTLISQILRMGGREQPPIDKKSRRMRNDCGCTVVVAHEGNRTLISQILLIGRPGLTPIDKKFRRMRTGCFGQISLFVTARALAQDDEKLKGHG